MQNFMTTIINAVKFLVNSRIDDSKADWNESNERADSYIKNKPDVALQSDIEAFANEVDGMLDGMQDSIYAVEITANGKMNADNPVGTGSFSMNRKYGTAVGNYSHAEGNLTIASASSSHAEGSSTIASCYCSHAEGSSTTASGYCSHAEGSSTIASGYYSHAEGCSTTASGNYSHAEGFSTTASVSSSHAEGSSTTASASYSHAEGHFTVANSYSQHVQGEYNIPDTECSAAKRGKYAHIVGNGTSDTARSNANTLDWNGVGWFQGGLQVGGNAQDDGAKNVLLEGDAIPIPTTATVGQTIVVKSVDENGKPIEWEAVDPMVITSSTEGSTKKFQITVDDTGTLTVTEMIEQ